MLGRCPFAVCGCAGKKHSQTVGLFFSLARTSLTMVCPGGNTSTLWFAGHSPHERHSPEDTHCRHCQTQPACLFAVVPTPGATAHSRWWWVEQGPEGRRAQERRTHIAALRPPYRCPHLRLPPPPRRPIPRFAVVNKKAKSKQKDDSDDDEGSQAQKDLMKKRKEEEKKMREKLGKK